MRILIADDDAVSRRVLARFLRQWDYDVVEATDGARAWECLQEPDAPRLAILDWMMPGMTGPAVCREVRRASGRYTYLILLTVRGAREHLLQGLEAGADGCELDVRLSRDGVPVLPVVAVGESDDGDAMLVTEAPARHLDEVEDLDDAMLAQAWAALERLHGLGIAHRGITRHALVVRDDGVGFDPAEVRAGAAAAGSFGLRAIAEQRKLDLVIIDGSPGIGCPVIASVTGASLVLVVTEPTRSGEHDLKRVVQLTRHFGIPVAVCINKWDLNPAMSDGMEAYCRKQSIAVAGRIRYDRVFTHAQVQGRTVVECGDDGVAEDVRGLWATVRTELQRGSGRAGRSEDRGP